MTGLMFLFSAGLLGIFSIALPQPRASVSVIGVILYLTAGGLLAYSDPETFARGFFFQITVGIALVFGTALLIRDELEQNAATEGPFGSAPSWEGSSGLKRDFAMEAHLWAISLWCRIVAVPVAFAGFQASLTARHLLEPVSVMISAAAWYATGHFLARLHRWAHIVLVLYMAPLFAGSVLGAGFAMVGDPFTAATKSAFEVDLTAAVGFAASVFILSAILQRRAFAVCTPQMRALALRLPLEGKFRRKSPYFRIPLVLLIALAGFLLLVVAFVERKGR